MQPDELEAKHGIRGVDAPDGLPLWHPDSFMRAVEAEMDALVAEIISMGDLDVTAETRVGILTDLEEP